MASALRATSANHTGCRPRPKMFFLFAIALFRSCLFRIDFALFSRRRYVRLVVPINEIVRMQYTD